MFNGSNYHETLVWFVQQSNRHIQYAMSNKEEKNFMNIFD
jgi:hypothetical protein